MIIWLRKVWSGSFKLSNFDNEKILQPVQSYPNDLWMVEVISLENQLETYILNMCFDKNFKNLGYQKYCCKDGWEEGNFVSINFQA